MSRTKRGGKPVGYDYWSKRPCSGLGYGKHVNLLVWEKNNCTPSQFYMKNCEYTLLLRKGKSKYINNIGDSKTVHKFNNIIGNKVHPTEKPEELMKFYVENSSNVGDTVLDMFMGSGSTGVAALNTNRRFIGVEMEEKYFDIGVKRMQESTIKGEKLND